MSTPRVISAAAGSGKTTRLVREYLDLLRDGVPAETIIAITFTRAAGAELVERVSQCLRAGLEDAPARAELGPVFDEVYKAHLPDDPATMRAALRGLMNAPVGTTDSFVRTLLAEFALDAALPDGTGGAVPLDLDGAGDAPADVFRAAAREVVDPTSGVLPDASMRALRHHTLGDVLDTVGDWSVDLPIAPLANVALLELARPLAERALRAGLADGWKKVLKGAAGDVVQAWVDAGGHPPLPTEALFWVAERLSKSSIAAGDRPWVTALETLDPIDVGVARVPARDLLCAFRGWPGVEALEAADTLRSDLLTLARDAAPRALRAAAEQGALDYGLLNRAAIHLCENPPQVLRQRFRALLVDEAQDASPDQMALYRALTGLPGDGRTLRTTYVGDPRQSIYLFRGAEPRIFGTLLAAAVEAGTHESLDVNRRATPALNNAQKALFERIQARGIPGVDPIARVGSLDQNQKRELAADHPFPAPIVAVRPKSDVSWRSADAVRATVDVFLTRVDAARAEAGRDADTGAVLAPTWRSARLACAHIRALCGPAAAHLAGTQALFQSGVARDAAVWLRALWDGSDALSWAAVWRHPMVGLTDAGLVRLRDGVGLLDAEGAPFDGRGLGGALRAHALDPDLHDAVDVATFARVVPHLRAAADRLGRGPSAEVLDRLFASLRWRLQLRRGPDGDEDVARLEVLLDLVRQSEQAGVDPEAALRVLSGQDEIDAPRVHLDRGPTSVACTTIFQAKGLAWDHVCVVAIGGRSDGGRPRTRERVVLEGAETELVGVKLDPEGALAPVLDPVGTAAQAVATIRGDQERLRCAYVALTRARRSVTLGLDPGKTDGIHGRLAEAWLAEPVDGLHVVEAGVPDAATVQVRGHVVASGAFAVTPATPGGWEVVSPSSVHDRLSEDERSARLDTVFDTLSVRPGGPAVALPAAVSVLPAHVRGSILHEWLGAGGLDSVTATEGTARAWLAERRPDLPAAPFVAWLLAVSTRLQRAVPDVLRSLLDPAATRAFELPMIGVDDATPGAPRLLNGTLDLAVQRPDGRVDIIDFKGERAPGSEAEVRSQRTFRENVLQVDAYRRGLERAGVPVGRCSLLYTATGTWVSWTA